MRPYRQRHIVQHDVEPSSSPDQVISHESAHVLTLGDQLRSIELGNHALQHLVNNGRQHTLIVIRPQSPVDLGKSVYSWPGKHTAGNVDHLQVLGPGEGGNIPGLRADIICNGGLEPRDTEMGSFGVDLLLNTTYPRVLDRSVTTVDCRAELAVPSPRPRTSPQKPKRAITDSKKYEPLNSALLATQIPPSNKTAPAKPAPILGAPPPEPPKRAVRCCSSIWSLRHASRGSCWDMMGEFGEVFDSCRVTGMRRRG